MEKDKNLLPTNAMLPEVKTAKEKCIDKWMKKHEKAKRMHYNWDKYYGGKYLEQMKLIEETIKDLKRF